MSIQRYDELIEGGIVRSDDGIYVKHSDHKAVVAKQASRIAELEQALAKAKDGGEYYRERLDEIECENSSLYDEIAEMREQE